MNPKELEVLKILIHARTSMSLADFLSKEPTLIKSTVAAALAKLLKIGMIEVAGISRSGKVLCRTYLPTTAAREFILQYYTKEFSSISDIVPNADMCIALLRGNKNPQKVREEIARLKEMLREYEKSIGK